VASGRTGRGAAAQARNPAGPCLQVHPFQSSSNVVFGTLHHTPYYLNALPLIHCAAASSSSACSMRASSSSFIRAAGGCSPTAGPADGSANTPAEGAPLRRRNAPAPSRRAVSRSAA
jgi:hypothetical protein